MNITAALFDLDGVLLDTEPQYATFWTAVGRDFLPHDVNFARRIKGQTLTQIFDANFPDENTRRVITERLNAFERTMTFKEVPGALAFVRQLTQAQIPTAVVTSSNLAKMNCIRRALPTFGTQFTKIFTAEDAGRSKPAPDCYLRAASALGVDIATCLVFEDSLNGLRAARAAGAHVVALTTAHPTDVVAPLSDASIPSFENLTPNSLLELF